MDISQLHHPLSLLVFGLIVGIYSGIMGLGGGTIMIPVMMLLLGYHAKEALGTSLAVMVPPVTLLGAWEYYRSGNVRLREALWIAAGVAAGTLIGAIIAGKLPKETLKLIFGFVLVYVAGLTILGRQNLLRSMLLAALLTLLAAGIYTASRWLDHPPVPAARSPPQSGI